MAAGESDRRSQQRVITGNACSLDPRESVRYLQPARLDDPLEITVQAADTGRATMSLEQQAWRGPTLLAEGRIRIGCIETASWRPCRIPRPILDRLLS